ncbi:unnamed protein product, partial [Mesorhabditis belari]|uniref:Endonuclease/exonuclease/phosphatase domain-containing protein n=1 Tax=Mesorhabditis belari TaxID=2138241 RepID=A0AAF3EYP0_9BILA
MPTKAYLLLLSFILCLFIKITISTKIWTPISFARNYFLMSVLSLVSWNIDGLGDDLAPRMDAVYNVLKNIEPNVIFLQEVVRSVIGSLERLRESYEIFYSDRSCRYFTAILVKKPFNFLKHNVHAFENSKMARTLQTIEGELGSMKVFLLTTHLESLGENKKERKAQLDYCLQKMKEIAENNPDAVVFFGGDLNIREKEMPELPAGVKDAFLEAGSPKDERFTWDTQKNHNKFAGQAQIRFDRILWTGPLQIVSFKLEGRERLQTVDCFPSDHWAINCTFSAP